MIDRLVRDAAPYTDDEIRALPLDGAEAELREAILAEPHPRPRPARRARRRRVRVIPAIAVAVGLLVLVAALPGGDERPGVPSAGPGWAEAALRVANAVPRLLVGEPGWRVERADQFTVAEGEMSFRKGKRTLDLHWRTAGRHRGWVKDRAMSGRRLPDVEVLGARAVVFLYEHSRDDYTALWRDGRYTLELRVGYPSPRPALTYDEFRALLRSLEPVGVDEWLAAMPPSVVVPADSRRVVNEMLADMALPPGFDRTPLYSGGAVRDRYQLGAQVAGAVACGWIERWVAAVDAGDDSGAAEAVRAMQGSREWDVLREMDAAGDYPEVLWEYPAAMAGEGTISGGRPMSVEESYRDALGC
jgi:hypothetical protein